MENLLTATQLGERLGLRPRTLIRWAGKGLIPAVKPTQRVVRFEYAAVLEALRTPATNKLDKQPDVPPPPLPAACQRCSSRQKAGLPGPRLADLCQGCPFVLDGRDWLKRCSEGGRETSR